MLLRSARISTLQPANILHYQSANYGPKAIVAGGTFNLPARHIIEQGETMSNLFRTSPQPLKGRGFSEFL